MEYAELVPKVMTTDAYVHHKPKLTTIGVGGNGRTVLIRYDSLPAKYQQKIMELYGDVHELAKVQPIINAVVRDVRAEVYYNSYKLPTGVGLSNEHVERHTMAASWLNMIGRFTEDKKQLKATLNLTVMQFWDKCIDLIRRRDIGLPTSDKFLKAKLKDYKAKGYDTLIEVWRYGNTNTRKVVKGEKILLNLISDPRKLDDEQVAELYNLWASNNNEKVIGAGAVGYWRRERMADIAMRRDGVSDNYSNRVKQIKRKRPEAPLLLLNSDDNILDLYFYRELVTKTKDKNGNEKTKIEKDYTYRPALYVVLDPFNNYVLGYAIGHTVSKELIYEAYRNAAAHIYELTGKYYLPHQIQSDRWGISGKNTTELEQYFRNLAKFTPATLKVAQAKYIEPFFNNEWHKMLKLYPNYSGHNITAKQRMSTEHMASLKNVVPSVERMEEQIAQFIQRLRLAKDKNTGLSKAEAWLEAFKASPKSQEREIDEITYLAKMGKAHEYTNKITSGGVKITLNGTTYNYELSANEVYQYAGLSVQAYYDDNTSRVLLVNSERGIRILAQEYDYMPSALADYKEGDGKRFKQLMDAKKAVVNIASGKINELMEVQDETEDTIRAMIDRQSLLQMGAAVPKAIQYKANEGGDYNFLDHI
ncbi:MAG: hypothetical protein K2Q03_03625 [Sphingobacteriaceae bacterium]|nr:hypothetical protein [Sphingobacteriaceae bacterium]